MAYMIPSEGADELLSAFPVTDPNFPTDPLYVGLFSSQGPTSVPAADAVLSTETGVTEVTGDGYARVQINGDDWNAPQDASPNGRSIRLPSANFGPAGASGWDTANGFFVATSPTPGSGVAVFYANFNSLTAYTLADTDTLSFGIVLRIPDGT